MCFTCPDQRANPGPQLQRRRLSGEGFRQPRLNFPGLRRIQADSSAFGWTQAGSSPYPFVARYCKMMGHKNGMSFQAFRELYPVNNNSLFATIMLHLYLRFVLGVAFVAGPSAVRAWDPTVTVDINRSPPQPQATVCGEIVSQSIDEGMFDVFWL